MSYRDRLQQRLEDTGRPLRVGLIGAGQMGRGFAAQLLRMPGITLSAVLDVQRDRAEDALGQAGITPDPATTTDAAARAIENGGSVALGGIDELGALPLDIVVEATGVPDVGARAAVESLAAGMGFATLNVESDVTIGRYLAQLARESGAIYSVCRGDEPVETKILVDFARDLNFEVIAAGKGKNNPLDRYATPETLADTARAKGMNPKMLTSFVDGSKERLMDSALIILAAVVAGWFVQMYLTYQQSTAFNAQVRGLRKAGTVSVGASGKRYRGGRAYVAVAVDDHRIVRDALVLSGWTTFARGKALPVLVGAKANQVLGKRDYPGLSKQQREAARQAVELLGRGGGRPSSATS